MKTREEQIAEICHEVNKAICEAAGDSSQLSWSAAPEWQKASAVKGVRFVLENPETPDSFLHDAWSADKISEGWKYGEIKDPYKKTHPCLIPFKELPFEQRVKDAAFKSVVLSVSELL